MSDENDIIGLLERYLLAADKETFFATLVKGSQVYTQMRAIDHLNRYGLKMPADTRKIVEEMMESHTDAGAALVSFKTQLLQIAADEDPVTRAKRMKKFNDHFLYCYLNHPQPANVEKSGKLAAGSTEVSLPSAHNFSETLSLSSIVQKVERGDAGDTRVADLRPEYYHHLDLSAVLAARGIDGFREVLQSLTSLTHAHALPTVLQQYSDRCRQERPTATGALELLTESVLDRMTLAQIAEVAKAIPGAADEFPVIAAQFVKTFEADLDTTAQQEMEPSVRRAAQARMLAWADERPTSAPVTSLRTHVLREMVETDLEMNHVDEQVFTHYLANPLHYDTNVYPSLPTGTSPVRPLTQWLAVHRFPQSRWHKSEGGLVSECLQRLLADPARAMERMPSLASRLNKDFLSRQYCRVRLLSGTDAADATDVLGERELTRLREERRLRFVPWNRSRFQPGDRVNLLLEVKNVATVSVSVFELDTQSYYRSHNTPIDPRVNLDGLVPSTRLEKTLDTPPIVSRVVEFADLFEARRGTYVVEFVGGGLSSRAVVHVGGLTAVRQALSKGVLLSVVDEAGRLCADDTTGILVDGRLLRPQESLGGAILVPYASATRQDTAVLLQGGYAELYALNVPAESVSLNVGLAVHEESVAVGGVVRLLLVPQLMVNGRRVGLVSLRKVRVTVTSVNDEDVSNVTSFDELKLDARGKALSLDYLVPPRTKRLEVRTTAEFYSSAQEKYIDLASERTIGVNGKRGSAVYYDYYLTPDAAAEQDCLAQLLGKNGESYGKQRVRVHVEPVYRRTADPVELETDEQGRVRLQGIRSCASAVTIESIDAPSSEAVRARYTVGCQEDLGAVPAAYDVVEGETLELPLGRRDGVFHREHYELVRVARTRQQSIVEDLSASVVGQDGTLRLSGLTEGHYRFLYREVPGGKAVELRVIRGQRWTASPQKYLVTPRGIRRLLNDGLALSMRDYQLDATSGTAAVRVTGQDVSGVEVHAYAFTHLPRTLERLRDQLRGSPETSYGEEFALRQPKVDFLSGKKLGDEVAYVLERKRRRAYMGSTLEKPPGLLQRQFVRETAEDDERLEAGEDYGNVVAQADTAPRMMMAAAMPMYRSMPMGANVAYAKKRMSRAAHDSPRHIVEEDPSDYPITRLNTFLASAGWCATCLFPELEGSLVRFKVPLDMGYTTLVLIACDGKGSVMETHALPVRAQPRVDVRLAESKSTSRVYVQERVARAMQKGELYEVKDISSSGVRVIDDVATVLKVLRALSKESGLDEWTFLGQWATLSPRERLRKYNTHMCHEFNVFAYFKDPEFFQAVVRPHLVSKTKKSVVDHVLLGDTAALKARLADPGRLHELDVLEQTLLVATLAASCPAECAAIARAARETVGPAADRDPRLYERLFDSVMSGKDPMEEANAAIAAAVAGFAGGLPPGVVVCPAPGMMGGGSAPRGMPMGLMCSNGPMMDAAMAEDALCDAAEYACADGESGSGGADDVDGAGGGAAMQIRKYRVVDTTNEYTEKQYSGGARLPAMMNPFWCDAIEHFVRQGAAGPSSAGPLLTDSLMYATGSVSEMLLVAALTGVGVEKPTHTAEPAGQSLRMTLGGSSLVFSVEIREKAEAKVELDVLVTQRMCDPMDMYTHVDGARTLKPVTEFLVGKMYASHVVVTNATESELKLSLVTEVPKGAIPVMELEYTDNKQLVLKPLSTHTCEFHFYFPEVGDFTCYPASINKDGQRVVAAKPMGVLHVVRTRTITQLDTISDILNQGSKADIIAFMERENLHKPEIFTFDEIYWLLRDRDFYNSVVALLRRKCHFNETVWSYSILHADRETFREYMAHRFRTSPLYLRVLGTEMEEVQFVTCGLLDMDVFEYLEYSPLVNARAHNVGRSAHNIRNREFRQTYEKFMRYLFQKTPALTTRDYVYWCTYLLLQDRVDEALAMHAEHIAPTTGEQSEDLRLQRDYLAAYLSLYTDAPPFTAARETATRYLSYPIYSWRNRFIEVLNLIAEAEAAPVPKSGGVDAVTGADRNTAQAQTEPYIACELDGKRVRVRVSNMASFIVRFYRIDLEVLFSQNPFLDTEEMDYSYVAANHTMTVPVSAASAQVSTETVEIPAELAGSNLIVQVGSGAVVKSVTYFPGTMEVRVNRNFGQLRVVDAATGTPMPLVYVKAFAKNASGEVGFFKDGYTDMRGAFEYASVHGGADKLSEVEEFSLLVLSDTAGGSLQRTKPPSKTAEVTIGATQVRSLALQKLHERMVKEANSKYCV